MSPTFTNKLATYDSTLGRYVLFTPVSAHLLSYMHHCSSMFRTVTQIRTISLLNRFHYQCGRFLSPLQFSFLGSDSWILGQYNRSTLGSILYWFSGLFNSWTSESISRILGILVNCSKSSWPTAQSTNYTIHFLILVQYNVYVTHYSKGLMLSAAVLATYYMLSKC